MKHIIWILPIVLLSIGCGGGEKTPSVDPNAKATIVEEKSIYNSKEERDAKIDADPTIPAEVKEALKSGAGKLAPPGTPPTGAAPSAGGTLEGGR